MHDDALDADFSEGTVTNSVFEKCNENALDISMSKVKVKSVYIDGSNNKALNIKAGAQIIGEDVKIKNANIAISAEDASNIDLENVTITYSQYGVVAYKNKPGGGHPTIKIKKLALSDVKQKYLKEKKSTIIVEGKEIEDEVSDVENIIKGDKKK